MFDRLSAVLKANCASLVVVVDLQIDRLRGELHKSVLFLGVSTHRLNDEGRFVGIRDIRYPKGACGFCVLAPVDLYGGLISMIEVGVVSAIHREGLARGVDGSDPC